MKPFFSRNDDVDKTAFLNWRISKHKEIKNLINIADGFMLSSIKLAENCLVDNIHKEADILIFPILTNANHGIELYLKALIWTLNEITGSGYRIEGKHNIMQIFQTVNSKIRNYNGQISIDSFNEIMEPLKRYIDELFQKIQATPQDDKMDFSRYPISVKYESHFYVDEVGNVEVDLENLVFQFNEIRSRLDYLANFLYYNELKGGY